MVALFFIIGVLLRLMGCGANVGCNVSFVGVDSPFEYVIMVCVWSMSKGVNFVRKNGGDGRRVCLGCKMKLLGVCGRLKGLYF